MRTETEELILLKNIFSDPIAANYKKALEERNATDYARAYELLLECDHEDRFGEYIARKILFDDNLFAKRAFEGNLTPHIREAYRRDLVILQNFAKAADSLAEKLALPKDYPCIRYGDNNSLFGPCWSSERSISSAEEFYRKNGYGIFIGSKAFTFENGNLCPVRNTSDISLSDLKDYETEKRLVEDNVVNFVQGLPFTNMLLYGDKGTGKSSTVHAVLNKYAEKGLRAVEIPKNQIKEINAVKELLAVLPFKFLLFIDDLSLEEHDENVTSLKASLEGSMNEKSANVMIAATSNRRHILKENFSDRENSVHARDTMEEQLSLSDRFGLTVCFSSTGKNEYLSIVRQLAEDAKITMPQEELFSLAERWALIKGGRSPRRAKQFIDYIYSCTAKGSDIYF